MAKVIRKSAYIMASTSSSAKSNTLPKELTEPLLLCPLCNIEMCLLGIESESDTRDLYTFQCVICDGLEVRGVRVKF